MSYDEGLAQRIRKLVADRSGLTEKKMFGGVSFLIQGNMACGVLKDEMIVRIDPEQHDAAVAKPHVRTFDYAGHPMQGWIFVGPAACASEVGLKEWVDTGIRYALSLSPK